MYNLIQNPRRILTSGRSKIAPQAPGGVSNRGTSIGRPGFLILHGIFTLFVVAGMIVFMDVKPSAYPTERHHSIEISSIRTAVQ